MKLRALAWPRTGRDNYSSPLFISLSARIVGSSVRDESLYSTATQKQSFDSVTLSQCQSIKFTNHGSVKAGTGACAEGLSQRNNLESIASMPEDDDVDAADDINNEIRISISCNRAPMRAKATWSTFFRDLFNWKREKRNIGYYSPPMEHPIGKISIRLNAGDVKGDRRTANARDADGDGDSISNSSLKDVSTAALKDELSTYMEELRLRELRWHTKSESLEL